MARDKAVVRGYMAKYLSSPKGKATREAYYAMYKKTFQYRYTHARKAAIKRGIDWQFTLEEWKKVWVDSGHWEERGPLGYQMCRYGDCGPYHKDNVYIAFHTQNKSDAWYNGKTCYPPRKKKGTKHDKEQRV